jgi:hypothetical protein
MDIIIHPAFCPHDGPAASLAFYRGTLAFEVREDAGCGGLSRVTAGPAGQPGTSIPGLHVRP